MDIVIRDRYRRNSGVTLKNITTCVQYKIRNQIHCQLESINKVCEIFFLQNVDVIVYQHEGTRKGGGVEDEKEICDLRTFKRLVLSIQYMGILITFFIQCPTIIKVRESLPTSRI